MLRMVAEAQGLHPQDGRGRAHRGRRVLAGSLGLEVVAEGVETEAQRAFLESRGCAAFQGYLYSTPIEPAEVLTFLGKD